MASNQAERERVTGAVLGGDVVAEVAPWAFRLADVTSTRTGVIMQTFELDGKPTYGSVEVS